jgi:hypothetical protein
MFVRVFLSSTYFDLKYLRADLNLFGQESGFEFPLFEHGKIPIPSDTSIIDAIGQDMRTCEMFVCIVGGSYGSVDPDSGRSFTHNEMKIARELQLQSYFFVEQSVLNDFAVYKLNPDASLQYPHVRDPRVFELLREIQGDGGRTLIQPFATPSDLIGLFREQASGLFKSLLNRRAAERLAVPVQALLDGVKMIGKITDYLSSIESGKKQEIIDAGQITHRHPLFRQLRDALELEYSVVFESRLELGAVMKQAGYTSVPADELLQADAQECDWWFVSRRQSQKAKRVGIPKSLFDPTGKLNSAMLSDWSHQYVMLN